MCQRDVERTLGRLLTDEQFRREFRVDPDLTARAAGLELSLLELEALDAIPGRALARLCAHVDARIRRLAIPIDSNKEQRP